MKKNLLFIIIVLSGGVLKLSAQTPVFNPGLTAICWNACMVPGPSEDVQMAIDGDINTKFLDFSTTNTGFYVNTGFSSVVVRLDLTTANDAQERDPVDYIVEGSNDGTTWNLISSGATTCFLPRLTTQTINFSNSVYYSWYRVRFNDVCEPPFANSMQIAEVQLYANLILPVKLISFTVQEINNKGLVKWKLAQPEADATMEVQKSSNGSDFTTINSQVSSDVGVDYSYVDVSLNNSDINYYRLKITDNTNKITYSNIALLKTGQKDISFIIYPNPVRKGSSIQLSTSNASLLGYKLINGMGQVLLDRSNIQVNGSATLILPENIQRGIYFIVLQTDRGVVKEKIVIQ